MNCHQIRHRILALEQPSVLSGELAGHVKHCSSCLTWYRKFVQFDRAMSRLPIPESDGFVKAGLLEKIRTSEPPIKEIPLARLEPAAPRVVVPPKAKLSPAPVVEAKPRPIKIAPLPMPVNLEDDPTRPRRSLGKLAARFWPASLVAATLLVGVITWMSLRGNRPVPTPPGPADPLLDQLVKLNVELAKSQSASERIVVLARLADELNQEMRDIARADATGENMQALEGMYKKVVLTGLIVQAKELRGVERELVLKKIVEGLKQAEQNAQQTAAQAPEHSARVLRDAAAVAKEGQKRLDQLIREAFT